MVGLMVMREKEGNVKMEEPLRSSADWQYFTGVIVMDPDGWDRRKFDKSWAEKITYAEFKHRVGRSTVDFRSLGMLDML